MAIRKDLTTEALTPWIGDDHTIRCTLDENGSISGWNFGFEIRESQSNSSAVVDDSDAGITVSINDAGGASSAGVIDVVVTDTVTETLRHKHDYWYSLYRTDAGSETTLVHGVWRSLRK